MIDILTGSTRACDGVSRRNFLRVGGLAVGGLTLPALLRSRAAAREANGRTPARKSVITIFQAGGPSHIDTYDLKPSAPPEYRGEFKPIATAVPGVEICEHLPLQAAEFDKISVVRSASHTNPGHGMGSQWMITGWQPNIEINDNLYPAAGSVVARLKGTNEPGMPAYVNLPSMYGFGKAAYLGASYNPFSPEHDPNSEHYQVRNLKQSWRVDGARLDARRQLLAQVDTLRRDVDTRGDLEGLDQFYRDAFQMITSEKALRAFDINREDPRLRERYGRNILGQSCLLARRLVEAGVTFVFIQAGGGWDTHSDNFNQLKTDLLPWFDRAVAALVRDLYDRGMQDDVLVTAFGEFGRTPRVNGTSGRDHWPGAMSVVFAGGGLRMGQAIGATDSRAEYPTSTAYSPGSLLGTMYHTLGIDQHHVFYDQARRPFPVLPEGNPIPELVG
jgi:uncharacterized protein (DUF1501 family)